MCGHCTHKGDCVHGEGPTKKHPRRMDARLGRIYGKKKLPVEAKTRALKAKMGSKTRAAVEKM